MRGGAGATRASSGRPLGEEDLDAWRRSEGLGGDTPPADAEAASTP